MAGLIDLSLTNAGGGGELKGRGGEGEGWMRYRTNSRPISSIPSDGCSESSGLDAIILMTPATSLSWGNRSDGASLSRAKLSCTRPTLLPGQRREATLTFGTGFNVSSRPAILMTMMMMTATTTKGGKCHARTTLTVRLSGFGNETVGLEQAALTFRLSCAALAKLGILCNLFVTSSAREVSKSLWFVLFFLLQNADDGFSAADELLHC